MYVLYVICLCLRRFVFYPVLGCVLSLSGVCYACEFTANEGPVRIQYKCLVPIYVQYSEKGNCYFQNRIICSIPQFLQSYICERFTYFQDRSAILLQENMWIDPGNI
jgi:hypothetical protein